MKKVVNDLVGEEKKEQMCIFICTYVRLCMFSISLRIRLCQALVSQRNYATLALYISVDSTQVMFLNVLFKIR